MHLNGERVTDVARELRLGKGPGAVPEVIVKVGRKIARVISKG